MRASPSIEAPSRRAAPGARRAAVIGLAAALTLLRLAAGQAWAQPLLLRGISEEAAPVSEPLPEPLPAYRVTAPETAPTEADGRGSVRRLIQPFGPWTLICDENLRRRRRVCNVSQTIADRAGATVFSWSLAATRAGAAAFILRAPVVGAGRHFVTLTPEGGAASELTVELTRCDARQCLGFLDVTPALRGAIAAGRPVAIAYRPHEGAPSRRLPGTLDGLAAALAAIR
ncbi:invasion associated locus B family protein [Methylobacterium sp. A54F]